MSTLNLKMHMLMDYSNRNLQNVTFKNEDLTDASFAGSDLRGADFIGSNLSGADLTHIKTGIIPLHRFWIFLAALIVSGFSGYVAMLAGHNTQEMLASTNERIRTAGIICVVVVILFILFCYLKGVGNAIKKLLLPVVTAAVVTGIASYLSGVGTGEAMFYLVLSFFLVAVMFVVGTVARAVAGSLSVIIFWIVALFGAFFGKSLGGGIGTAIMAIACAMISKKALAGAKGFESLRKVCSLVTEKFGTSFRHTNLSGADLSNNSLKNCDFSNADTTSAKWNNSKKINCI